jgi:N-acetylmuramoyl-L-alanine amidase
MSNVASIGVIGFVSIGALVVGAALRTDANASTTTMPQAEFYSATFKDVPGAPIDTTVKVVIQDEDIPIQSADHFYLAATMWGEARGEGRLGMGFVGHVIMNRVAEQYRGDTISEVATANKQFSCWNSNDPNKQKLDLQYLEHTSGAERDSWIQAKALAWYIMNGSKDYTNGALHYHTNEINPYWSGDYQVAARQGNHVFYR